MQVFAQIELFLQAHALFVAACFLICGFTVIYRASQNRPLKGERMRAHIVTVGTQSTRGLLRFHRLTAQGYAVISCTEKGVFTMRKYYSY
jgi:hypothetical protein